jgi:hypothetical protein
MYFSQCTGVNIFIEKLCQFTYADELLGTSSSFFLLGIIMLTTFEICLKYKWGVYWLRGQNNVNIMWGRRYILFRQSRSTTGSGESPTNNQRQAAGPATVQHEFLLYLSGDGLQRRHVFFPSRIILEYSFKDMLDNNYCMYVVCTDNIHILA